MTYREIVVAIEGTRRRRRADLQEQAVIAYRQSEVIASFVANVFGSKSPAPTIEKAFPGIFPERQIQQQDWRVMKARMEAFAEQQRKRGEMKDGNDARGAPSADHGGDARPPAIG